MKFKSLSVLFLSLFVGLTMFTSCDDDNDSIPKRESIVEIASKNTDLSILVEALQKADLVSAIDTDGPFTVFAPTNEAFQGLLDSNNSWNSLEDIPDATLKAVLLYHVVSAQALSTDLSNNQEITTLNGANITIDLSSGVMINTGSGQSVSVVQADVLADNGVVHVVDEVMLPNQLFMSIVEIASANNSFSTLVAALQRADLVSTLQGDGPFTVFAPTNDAFQKLLDSNNSWNSLEDIPVETLKSVLLYHVVGAQAFSGDLSNGQEIITVETSVVTVDLSNGVKLTTGAGQSVAVTTADIQASNGVIHIIDDVMLMSPLFDSIVEIASGNDNFTTLVAALQKADLVSALQADGPFTVFAPTNDAFQALLDSNSSWNSLDDIPVETLKSVLLYHVLGSKVMSSDLSDTYVNTLATGPDTKNLSLQVEVTGGVEFNGDAKPVAIDIMATNGVVHVIDKVMLPADIVTVALNNAGFSTLVAALTDERHTTDFVTLLRADGPYTVFAPTNDAFQALLDSNDAWNGLGDIPIATLDAVLRYHVFAGGNVQSSQLTDDQEITMFDGNMLTVDLSSGAKLDTASGQSVMISVVDVQGTNGVIHAVDTVLLP
ncbi:fasciclin domain-containing protein [Tenacibaculum soleae]|uniref:fasciclin domain-containing protein n=1 Tax=Tenacibaculum soleae TaxID=447689 RepID=UPI0026E260CE|nr:fasciclin domain-containing protein [Tenacibaculum soleae]MDO6744426.1 fasciclin domain-containing protein [Tenacibaculum soleae]